MAPKPPKPVVLLIGADDSVSMYAEYLRWAGFKVFATAREEEALARAASADVIVADVGRPNDPCSDLPLVVRLRYEHRATPIAVLTACTFSSPRDCAQGAGADVWLTKPCLPDSLLRHLHRLLANSHLHRARPLPAAGACLNPQHRRKRISPTAASSAGHVAASPPPGRESRQP